MIVLHRLGFLSHLRSRKGYDSQKSSLVQSARSVSEALMADTPSTLSGRWHAKLRAVMLAGVGNRPRKTNNQSLRLFPTKRSASENKAASSWLMDRLRIRAQHYL
jgi:hypothetical protein